MLPKKIAKRNAKLLITWVPKREFDHSCTTKNKFYIFVTILQDDHGFLSAACYSRSFCSRKLFD